MGTLQSELSKVKPINNLDNLQFDDDPGGSNIVAETEEVLKKSSTMRRTIWEYLRNSPMSSGAEVAEALEIPATTVYRQIGNMYHQSMLSRQLVNGLYRYTPTATEYPHRTYPAHLINAWARRSELAKEGKLSERYKAEKEKREAPKPAPKKAPEPAKAKPAPTKLVKKRSNFKVIGKAPLPPIPAAEPVKETIQMVPSYDPNVVSSWPVSMARAFYLELKKYFGDV